MTDAGPLRLGITGATGRMGREVLAAVDDREGCDAVFAVNRSPDVDAIDGVTIASAGEFEALVREREPHAVVDFTGPDAALAYADACATAGVAFVTGTTGFDDEERERLRQASDSIPVLHASNFSRGVAVLDRLVAAATRSLPDFDVELVETHHRGKRDAPSGTANTLLETVESAREEAAAHGDDADVAADDAAENDAGREETARRVHGREGEAPRQPGEIGVHAVRAGAIPGEHELLLAGDHEELRLTHRAGDRGVFAAGALEAADWLAGRDPGWYDFSAVIEG